MTEYIVALSFGYILGTSLILLGGFFKHKEDDRIHQENINKWRSREKARRKILEIITLSESDVIFVKPSTLCLLLSSPFCQPYHDNNSLYVVFRGKKIKVRDE
jgi:hypothetical protein